MKTFDDRKKRVQQYMANIQARRRKAVISVTSAVLVVAILAVVLFIPYDTTPPDVRAYSASEYYGLIEQINSLRFQPPKYENRFQALINTVRNAWVKKAPTADQPIPSMPNAAPDSQDPVGDINEYVEVTDNQVQDVIEADIFKRSDKYVYYLLGETLSVFSIAEKDSQLVGTYSIDYASKWNVDGDAPFSYLNTTEMYLSADCRTVTVVIQCARKTNGALTLVVNLDVSDPANITEKGRVYFVGSYLSSRMVDGDLLLSYNYGFRLAEVDFDDPTTFVPQYGTPGNMTCIPGDAIICPEDVSDARYTVVCKLRAEDLQVAGTVALLGYSQELYVSLDTIYATRGYAHKEQAAAGNQYRQKAMTEITGISYADDALTVLGSVAVEGSVKDQYSMDQYDGILRVVTSTNTVYLKESNGENTASLTVLSSDWNANLYCVDLSNWKITAEVIAFAPPGEDAQSVRFEGTKAYVCTAEVIKFTDPVYFFDLSDLDHITWTETGTIEGYSTDLIDLGNGFLMGIGYGERSQLKIEVYREMHGMVVSCASYKEYAYFQPYYKSYLIDREYDLIGLPIAHWNGPHYYILARFDGYQLVEVARIRGDYGDMTAYRAFLEDGWLYLFAPNFQGDDVVLHVEKIFSE
ncbi:MAG: beta-propeller domain-containing protein [Oscillospiraceae bacterium]|nr:beta-propeller domain-containing protein [Oscillospiraceae bacterium]